MDVLPEILPSREAKSTFSNHLASNALCCCCVPFRQIQRKLDAVRCMNKPLQDAERQLRARLEHVHRSLGPPQRTLTELNSILLQVCDIFRVS